MKQKKKKLNKIFDIESIEPDKDLEKIKERYQEEPEEKTNEFKQIVLKNNYL